MGKQGVQKYHLIFRFSDRTQYLTALVLKTGAISIGLRSRRYGGWSAKPDQLYWSFNGFRSKKDKNCIKKEVFLCLLCQKKWRVWYPPLPD
jgi:hypothetical protein